MAATLLLCIPYSFAHFAFPTNNPLSSQTTPPSFLSYLLEHQWVHHPQGSDGRLHYLTIIVQQWHHVVQQVTAGSGLLGVLAEGLVIQRYTGQERDRDNYH